MHITPSAELGVAHCPPGHSALRLVAKDLRNHPTTAAWQGWFRKRAHIIARCLRLLLPVLLAWLSGGDGQLDSDVTFLSVNGSIPWVAESHFGMRTCVPYQYLPIDKTIRRAMTEFSGSSGRAANDALDRRLTASAGSPVAWAVRFASSI
mgnify:CR=1 FL=1